MILTSRQLKDKVKNFSGGNTQRSQMLIRTFMMERFLERVSASSYRNNFILKGGMLVSAFTGVELRATMDIDTTVKAVSLTQAEARKIVEEIMNIDIGDEVSFAITSVSDIMEGQEYPGIRFKLEGTLDRMRQPIKIDISTGDIITPRAIEFAYKLMFEDRSIAILSYNLETLLAEKLETILSRGIANTRMRDFYDIHVLMNQFSDQLDYTILEKALFSVCEKRESTKCLPLFSEIIDDIEQDDGIRKEWDRYQKANFYVEGMFLEDAVNDVKDVLSHLSINKLNDYQ